jgi:hypothetical protein
VSIKNKDEKRSTLYGQDKIGKINIYDKLGHIVMEEKLNSYYQEMDTSLLQPDIYIVEVTFGAMKSRTKMMVIK